MKWFKHMANATDNKKIALLMDEFGVDAGYAMYFKFIELCAAELEQNPNKSLEKFQFSHTIVRRKLRKSATKVELFLRFCDTFEIFSYTKVEKFYNIEFPKLLEIMNKDEKYRRKKNRKGFAKKRP